MCRCMSKTNQVDVYMNRPSDHDSIFEFLTNSLKEDDFFSISTSILTGLDLNSNILTFLLIYRPARDEPLYYETYHNTNRR